VDWQLARLIHDGEAALTEAKGGLGFEVGCVAIFATTLEPQKALHLIEYSRLS
jgi:hypothetical protein